MTAPRLIAFYLPQYHPIPENDAWWGKGFTEWTNVAKAQPLFPGHDQPRLPADLGFYDLRVPETRAQQAALAAAHGLESFCYYHYWFGGKELLERPLREVVASGRPDFGFCVCWANQTWTGVWHGSPDRVLAEQTYPGEDDHRAHFDALLPMFTDPRYTRVGGLPLFLIYRPMELPDARRTCDLWRELAVRAGLGGLYLTGVHEAVDWCPGEYGFDAFVHPRLPARRGWVSGLRVREWLGQKYESLRGFPTIHDYAAVADSLIAATPPRGRRYPCVIPNWDNTPRSGADGLVLRDSTPALFRGHFRQALAATADAAGDDRLIFVKSWNEWAEGNFLEPDRRHGLGYLEAIRDELARDRSSKP